MTPFASHFTEHGWAVVDFTDLSWIIQARSSLQEELNYLLSMQCPLEEYHRIVKDDQVHTDLQFKLTAFFRKMRFGPEIIRSNLEIFKSLLGLDLWVQGTPYLRMTRPNTPQDNIGYHRDTFYGGSPYEVSVLIPFVDLESRSSLSVLSGSHILPENRFPTKQIQQKDSGVIRGSAKHQLGFLYAPKVMDDSIEPQMTAIPLKVGQALIFSLATVHGSVLNKGLSTRWSTDIRVMNGLAPVDFSDRPNYYEVVSESPITFSAKKYLEANEKEKYNI